MINDINWARNSLYKLSEDSQKNLETNLIKIDLPFTSKVKIYLKDESSNTTGSLKYRLAKSLFAHAVLQGKLTKNSTVIDASSGNTAISEAYFAKLLDLPYIAVMVKSTSKQKIDRIKKYKGRCYLIEKEQNDVAVAEALAEEITDGYFMNQFESAKQVFGISYSDNFGDEILDQMKSEDNPIPNWFICGVGTGGTAQSLTECILKNSISTKLCIVDSEFSAYYQGYLTNSKNFTTSQISRIEGIGRRQISPSFNSAFIDKMIKVPDAASIAAIHFIKEVLGLKVGGSTGTNIYSAFLLAYEMYCSSKEGSIVTLCCDSGDLYNDTYYNNHWVTKELVDFDFYYNQIKNFYKYGKWQSSKAVHKCVAE
ncbi:MAG: pyridoxal-phosphate dependent enzyme [Gammaproteobacteria bacterium]|nr:MAG: pyridoxal-phosphate dependent enzyme [Gammaproteobacteria bacterium]UTW41550.1 pyridoxal-phosphate dependent enzyme [bacterium SCSIO 12844]